MNMKLYPENGDCLSIFDFNQSDALRMIARGATLTDVVQECNDREEDLHDLMKDIEAMLAEVQTIRRILNNE